MSGDECDICGAEKHPQAYTCRRCKGILDRVETRRDARAPSADSIVRPGGSPNLTGVPPGQLPPLEQPEPAGRYGARASVRTLATVRDRRRVFPRRAWRAARAGDSTRRW